MTIQRKIASSTNKKAVYDGVMKTIKWSKVNVPVSKNPFGDQVDKEGNLDENV